MKPVCVLLLMLCFPSSCYPQKAPTPEEAFNSYEAYLNGIRNVSLDAQFSDRVTEKNDTSTNTLSQKWRIDFEGKRLWNTTRKVIENPKTGSDRAQASRYNESLVTPNADHQISVDANKATVMGFGSYLNVPKDYWKRLGFGYLSYPFGYIKEGREYKYIPDMIRKAPKKIVSEEGNASSLVVLACETEDYALNIGLDPSKGWMAERIELKRIASANDELRPDYCLYTVEHSSDHGGVWLPDSYHCEVSRPAGRQKLPDNVRMVDGKLIMVRGDAKEGEDSIERGKATLIAEVTLSDIDLSPLRDSEFQLETNIPNGTKVSMQDAQHLEFVWRDGKAVPVTDEALKALRGSMFLGGPGSPRFWIVVFGFAIMSAILYLKINDWRKNRSA